MYLRQFALFHALSVFIFDRWFNFADKPLDIGENKPFKDYFKRYWVKYMHESDNVENGNVITRQQLSFWITESFKEVSDNSIRKTFEKCGYY